MASAYYQPCAELTRCEELIEKYYKTEQYEVCFRGHMELAQNGYPLAECQVGYFYYDGLGVEKDEKKAFYWTKRSAEHGDRDGQFNLAWFYEEGIGTRRDEALANQWYKKAAEQGHDLAIKKLTCYFHASPVKGIEELQPRISNHGVPLIYFSKKRENVLLYLSNAVEKYCRETGFVHEGKWQKWGPYGFDENGKLVLDEYYPNAFEKTYKGVAGYIYMAKDVEDSGFVTQIPDAVTSSVPVPVCEVEYVEDAYEALLQADAEGKIKLRRYETLSDEKKEWIKKTIRQEYESAKEQADYRHFLKGNFGEILC